MGLRLFTDIDDTFMTTGRKVPVEKRVVVGAFDRDGAPSSFMTSKHIELWERLARTADSVVPVSARSVSALSRLTLVLKDGAIADFGATILTAEGTEDLVWRQRMQAQSAVRQDGPMFELLQHVIEPQAPTAKVELRVVNGVPVFINFRGEPGSSARIRPLVEQVLVDQDVRGSCYLHVTDRDVTVLPTFISKGVALTYFVAKMGWGDDLLIGAGDSLNDCTFLNCTDFAVLPRGSRAFTALHGAANANGEVV